MNEDSKTAASLKGLPQQAQVMTQEGCALELPQQTVLFPAIATAYITWGRYFVNLVTSGTS